jgi:hypothetical protein
VLLIAEHTLLADLERWRLLLPNDLHIRKRFLDLLKPHRHRLRHHRRQIGHRVRAHRVHRRAARIDR